MPLPKAPKKLADRLDESLAENKSALSQNANLNIKQNVNQSAKNTNTSTNTNKNTNHIEEIKKETQKEAQKENTIKTPAKTAIGSYGNGNTNQAKKSLNESLSESLNNNYNKVEIPAAPKQPFNLVPDSPNSNIINNNNNVSKKTKNQSKNHNQNHKSAQQKRLFVLDTNVLLHDPTSLFRFEEHDIYLSMMVLEELDHNKKGLSEVARNARMISRSLDLLLTNKNDYLIEGVALNGLGNQEASGNLFFQTQDLQIENMDGLSHLKADNQILSVVHALQKKFPERQIVLVSKDINMRIKANALNLKAEDYFNDHVIEDTDLLYQGYLALPDDFWASHSNGMESWQNPKTGETFYKLQGPTVSQMMINQFVYLDNGDGALPFYAQVHELNHKFVVLKTITDYGHQKHKVWGVMAKNKEQNFALNLLMNPEVDFVSLLGQAGTGKTLLTLAAALEQVIQEKRYNEIIVTRATVPLGEDIGFLPGTEEEKMQPWMGALDDNLEVLQGDSGAGDWGKSANIEYIRSKIKIKSMSFMRGRTFVSKFVIIDEAQNLTPKQMKALITRAGPNTKIVCMGNIAQIDTPYLTEGSSGLTYVVDRFKAWKHGGHITLARGERSRLADFASEVL